MFGFSPHSTTALSIMLTSGVIVALEWSHDREFGHSFPLQPAAKVTFLLLMSSTVPQFMSNLANVNV